MGSLLAFPLATPLGGVQVAGVGAEALGQDLWRVFWIANADPSPAAFMIYVDGQHWGTVENQTSVEIRGEQDSAPIVQVVQIAAGYADPGFDRDGYFTAPLNNKLQVTWDPPADVTDVDKYRVYFDNKTGTVDFTSAIAELQEDGSSSYEAWTPQLSSGTYLFVIRTVDTSGNESTNVATSSQTLVTYPGLVTAEAFSIVAGPRVTITWTDPSDIGSGDVTVHTNGGSATNLLPDYDTVVATIAAGVETFTSGVLGDGIHVFGLRVSDGTNRELNTYIWLVVRLESGAEVSSYPPFPSVTADTDVGGKILLTAEINPRNPQSTVPTKVQFYTNDGAGGAVDFGTPLEGAGLFTLLNRHGPGWLAQFSTAVFGETARVFSAKAFTDAGVPSVQAANITITPDATVPPNPLNSAATAGRA